MAFYGRCVRLITLFVAQQLCVISPESPSVLCGVGLLLKTFLKDICGFSLIVTQWWYVTRECRGSLPSDLLLMTSPRCNSSNISEGISSSNLPIESSTREKARSSKGREPRFTAGFTSPWRPLDFCCYCMCGGLLVSDALPFNRKKEKACISSSHIKQGAFYCLHFLARAVLKGITLHKPR